MGNTDFDKNVQKQSGQQPPRKEKSGLKEDPGQRGIEKRAAEGNAQTNVPGETRPDQDTKPR